MQTIWILLREGRFLAAFSQATLAIAALRLLAETNNLPLTALVRERNRGKFVNYYEIDGIKYSIVEIEIDDRSNVY